MDWKRLYSGYCQTPFLWKGTLDGMEQFAIDDFPTPSLQKQSTSSKRLGALAEHFAFDYWEQTPEMEIIARNLQINGLNETLGEIDTVLRYKEKLYHVEMAYKVYLYDGTVGTSPLEHWIGPNRKDSLVDKLNRLQSHQLPLLKRKETQDALEKWVDTDEEINSCVWIKAHLFLPFETFVAISPLNQACIAGYYISRLKLNDFEDHKFFLPSKLEWMITPHAAVNWLDYKHIQEEINPLLERSFSPMIWLKAPSGVSFRMFVTWW